MMVTLRWNISGSEYQLSAFLSERDKTLEIILPQGAHAVQPLDVEKFKMGNSVPWGPHNTVRKFDR